MHGDEAEVAYYRAIEDFFAAARGVPHILSPKDVQLMIGWWRENIPLDVITSAVAEVFARKRAQDDDNPAVSLTYCRHAVKAQARRYAELRVGRSEEQPEDEEQALKNRAAVQKLADTLTEVAGRHHEKYPALAKVLDTVAAQLLDAADIPGAALDDHLFNLESALLDGCRRALPDNERQEFEKSARSLAARSGAVGEALERSIRALADRELRTMLGLPRLHLG